MNSKDPSLNQIDEKWIPMAEASGLTPYSSEYLSLLARKGKLTAKKIDGVWYTTKSILDDYMKRQMIRAQIQNGSFPNQAPVQQVIESKPKLESVQPPEPVALRNSVVEEKPSALASLPVEKKDLIEKEPLNAFDISRIRQISQASLKPETLALDASLLKGIRTYKGDQKVHLERVEKNTPPKPVLPDFTPAHTEQIVHAVEKAITNKVAPSVPSKIKAKAKHHLTNALSTKILVGATAACIILFTITPVPLVFSFLGKSIEAVKSTFGDARTVMGFRPGTGPNEILLLDKNGNVSIMGSIQTDAQLQSFIKDGIAPITIESKTLVKNLNAEYLSGASSTDFTLAFVTKNGAITTEDVKLEGNVEVGKTLTVRGATKLLSSLNVDGRLRVLGDAEFTQMINVLGPAYFNGVVTLRDNVNINKNLAVKGSITSGSSIIGKNGSFNSMGINGDLSVGGKTKLNNVEIQNSSTTNSFIQNLTAAVSNITSFIAGDITVGALSATNSTTTNATTTNLAITSVLSSILKTDANGSVMGAVPNVDYITAAITTLGDEFHPGLTGLVQTFSTSTVSNVVNSPSTVVDDASIGTLVWNTPANATASDNAYSFVSSNPGATSHYLKATNYGFAIPTGATINGILVEVERKMSGPTPTIVDNEIKIVKSDGSIGTTNKSTGDTWTTSDVYASYGGQSDLWGETWTPADINNANFGAVLSVITTLRTANVDHIRITVYYTPQDPNLGMSIVSSGTTHGFTPYWIGTLADSRIASSATWNAKENALTFLSGINRSVNTITLDQSFGAIWTAASTTFVGGVTMGTSTTTSATSTNFAANTICLIGDTCRTTWPIGNIYTANYPVTLSGLAFGLAFGTTTNNVWGGEQTFLASTTLQNFTALNSTTTNGTSTSFYTNTLSSLIARLTSIVAGDISVGALIATNSTSTSSTSTVSYIGSLIAGNSTSTNLFSTTASSTNLFATNGNIGTLTTGPITSGLINGQTISPSANFTGTLNVTSGLTTLSNLLLTGSTTLQNFTALNSTSTNSTSTSLFSTTGTFTNLFSNTLNLTNLLVTGSTTLQNFTFNNATGSAATTTNLFVSGLASTTDIHSITANLGSLNVLANGNVGIGTTSPGYLLDVIGGDIRFGSTANNQFFTSANSLNAQYGANSNATFWVNYAGYNGGTTQFRDFKVGDGKNNSVLMVQGSTGNVGIGTISPNFKLEVNGTASTTNFYASYATTTNSTSTSLFSTTGTFTNLFASTLNLINLLVTGSTTLQNFTFNNATGSAATTTNLYTSGQTILAGVSGNVGVGTTSPSKTLSIRGDVYLDNILYIGTNSLVNASDIVSVLGNGNGGVTSSLRNINAGVSASVAFNLGNNSGPSDGQIILNGSSNTTLGGGRSLNIYANGGAMTLGAGGSEAVRILSGGNVGIGTTSPLTKLHVYGTSYPFIMVDGNNSTQSFISLRANTAVNTDSQLYFEDSGTFTFEAQDYSNRGSGAGSSARVAIVGSTGYVGIGTTTPGAKLQVASDKNIGAVSGGISGVNLTQFSVSGSADATKQIRLGYDTTNNYGIIAVSNSSAWQDLHLQPNTSTGIPNLTIKAGGNVGIGTTTPQNAFHVVSGSDWIQLGSSGSDQIAGGRSGGSFGISTGSWTNGNMILTANNSLYFRTGGSNDRLFIGSTGNVGINTINPNFKLEVNGTASTTNFYASYATTTNSTSTSLFSTTGTFTNLFSNTLNLTNLLVTGSTTLQNFTFNNATGSAATTTNLYTSGQTILAGTSGNVGIGTTNPLSALEVAGGGLRLGKIDTASGHINAYELMSFNIDIDNDDADTRYFSWHKNAADGAGTELMRLTEAGNVGIGTTTPAENLTVNGSIQFGNTTSASGATNNFNSGRLGTYNSGAGVYSQYNFVQPANNKSFAIWNSGSGIIAAFGATGSQSDTRSYFVGNVGLGTTSPAYNLQIDTGGTQAIALTNNSINHGITAQANTNVGAVYGFSPTNGGAFVQGISDGDTYGIRMDAMVGSADPTDTTPAFNLAASKKSGVNVTTLGSLETVFQLKNLSTDLLTVLGSGNVGIGAVVPTSKLHVTSSVAGTITEIYNTEANDGNGLFLKAGGINSGKYALAVQSNAGASLLHVLANGNVGVGTISPNFKLEVNGTASTTNFFASYATTTNSTSTSLFSTTGTFTNLFASTLNLTNLLVTGSTTLQNFTFNNATGSAATTTNLYTSGQTILAGVSGNVGVGTNVPLKTLSVAGTGLILDNNLYFWQKSNTGTANGILRLDNTNDLSIAEGGEIVDVLFKQTGNVGIGTSTPNQKLTVSGTGTVKERIESTSSVGPRDAVIELFVNNNGGNDPAGSLLFNALNASGAEQSAASIISTYGSSANQSLLKFSTLVSGTFAERMRIHTDGNVGIGTASVLNPAGFTKMLQIGSSGSSVTSFQTTANTDQQWDIGVADPAGNGSNDFGLYDATVGVWRMVVQDVSGNVGIGTTTPQAKLHIYNGPQTGTLSIGGLTGSGQGRIYINADTSGTNSYLDVIGDSAYKPFTINANPLILNNGTGYVGIGTTTPAQLLTLASANPVIQFTDTDAMTAAFIDWNSGTGLKLHSGSNDLIFIAGNTEKMRVTSTGNVGIGITPAFKLEVNGTASTTNLYATNATSTYATSSVFYTSGQTILAGVGGRVGVGTNNPGVTFDVTGATRVSSTLTVSSITGCSGSQALQTNGSGDIACGTISTVGGASSGGGWTTNNIGHVSISTTTDRVVVGASTTPYAKLTVLSGNAATTTLALFPASAQTANIIDIYNTSGILSTVLTAGGSLGLGTTTPPNKLYVNAGDIGLDPNQKIKFNYGDTTRSIGYRTTGVQPGLDVQGDANGPATFANGGLALGSYGGGGTAIPNNGMIVSGNVGIGTTTPAYKLDVFGGDISINNTGGTLRFYNAATQLGYVNVGTGGMFIESLQALSLNLKAAGGVRLTVAGDTGNVGIGTSTPNNMLDVYSTTKAAIGFSGASGSTYKWTIGEDMADAGKFKIASSTALGTTDRFVIDGSGNVGIGSTSPDSFLSVNGTGASSLIHAVSNGTAEIKVESTAASGAYFTMKNTMNTWYLWNKTAVGDLQINDTTNNVLTLQKTSGNVGIGTISPNFKLEVNGTASTTNFYASYATTTNSTSTSLFSTTGTFTNLFASTLNLTNLLVTGSTTLNNFTFNNATGSAATTTNFYTSGQTILAGTSGNVGIGVDPAGYKLRVGGSISASSGGQLDFGSGNSRIIDGATSYYMAFQTWTGSAITEKMRITSGGNVGIGVTNPSEILTIATTTSAKLRINADTDNVTETDIAQILLTQDGGISTANVGMEDSTPGGNNLIIGVNSTTAPNIYFSTRTDGTSFAAQIDSKMVITNAGLVGVGTTTPANKIEAYGLNPYFAADGSSSTNAGYKFLTNSAEKWRIDTMAAASDRMRFLAGISTEVMSLTQTGNVGIGTTTPNTLLSLVANGPVLSLGSSGINDPRIDFYDQSTTAVGASMFLDQDQDTLRILRTASGSATDGIAINASGNVGLGTTNPANAKLEIIQAAESEGLRVDGASGGFSMIVRGGTIRTTSIRSGLTVGANYSATTPPSNGAIIEGNVGIGTSTPLGRLDIKSSGASYLNGLNLIDDNDAAKSSVVQTSGSLFIGLATAASGADAPGDFEQRVRIYEPTVTATNPILQLGDPDFTILHNGYVGIGTTTPENKLDVYQGNIRFATDTNTTSYLIWERSGTDRARIHVNPSNFFNIDVGGTDKFTIDPNGNVGIGSTTPGTLLSIGGSGTGWNFVDNSTTTSYAKGIDLKNGGCFAINGVCIGGASGIVGSGTTGQFPYYAANGTTLTATSTVFLATTGYVGIGTTSPMRKLDIFDTTNPQLRLSYTSGSVYSDLQTTSDGYLHLNSTGDRVIIDDAYLDATASTILLGAGGFSGGPDIVFRSAGAASSVISPVFKTKDSTGALQEALRFSPTWINSIPGSLNETVAMSALGTNIYTVSATPTSGNINFNVNVGIGTSSPFAKLSISNAVTDTINTPLLNISSTTGGTSTSTLFTVLASGNVGIGTNNPARILTINAGAATSRVLLQTTNTGSTIGDGLDIFETDAGNAGVWNYEAGNLSFGTSNTERMTVLSAGNVGIGTTTPNTKFQITADANTSGAIQNSQFSISGATTPTKKLYFGYNTSSNYGVISAETGSGAYSNIALSPYGGSVGIGTTTPARQLTIGGTGTGIVRITSDVTGAPARRAILELESIDANRAQGILTITTGAEGWFYGKGYSMSDFTIGYGASQSEYTAQSKLYITTAGLIGVSTTSPDYSITVAGAADPRIRIDGSSSQGIYFTKSGVNNGTFRSNSTGDFEFYTPTVSQAVVIKNSGNVGIGTTTPVSKLSISGQGTNGGLHVENTAGAAAYSPFVSMGATTYSSALGTFRFQDKTASQPSPSFIWDVTDNSGTVLAYDFQGGATTRLAITQDGNVGIGTNAPAAELHVYNSNTSSAALSTQALASAVFSGGNGSSGGGSLGFDYGVPHTNYPVGLGYKVSDASSFTKGALVFGTRDVVSDTAASERMRIDANGNVGISTTIPTRTLQVNATTTSASAFAANNVNTWATMAVRAQVAVQNGATGLIFHTDPNSTASPASGAGIAAIDTQVGSWGGVAELAFMTAVGNVSNERMRIAAAGNVGIGTTTPGAKLDVAGASPVINVLDTGTSYAISRYRASNNTVGDAYFGVESSGAAALITGGGSIPSAALISRQGAYPIQFGTNNITRMTIGSTGLVGIGTSTPKTTLHVSTSTTAANAEVVRLTSVYTAIGSGPLLRFTNVHSAGTNPNANEYNLAGIRAYDYDSAWGGALSLQTPNSGTAGGGNLVDRLVVAPGGNVGIGSTSPSTKLVVYNGPSGGTPYQTANTTITTETSGRNIIQMLAPNNQDQYLMFGSPTAGNRAYIGYQNPTFTTIPDLMVFNTSGNFNFTGGNVGIGTSTPLAKLSVYDGDESTTLTTITQALTNAGLNIISDYTASAYVPGLLWSTQDNNPTKPKAGIWLLEDGTGTDMYFGTSNSYGTGITNNGLVLDQSGYVGIGTTSPGTLFSIGGSGTGWNFNDNGTTTSYAKGIDLKNGGCFAMNGVCISGGGGGGSGTVGSGTAGQFPYYAAGGTTLTATSSIFVNTTNSFIGIGTVVPTNALDVVKSSASGEVTAIALGQAISGTNYSNITTATALEFRLPNNVEAWPGSPAGKIVAGKDTADWTTGTERKSNLQFYTADGNVSNNVERMRITSGGNVGIGTTSPATTLQTYGATGLRVDMTGTTDNNTLILNQRAGFGIGGRNMIQFSNGVSPTTNMRFGYDNGATGLQFRSSANAVLMTVMNAGNVGIGITNPGSLLDINQTTAGVNALNVVYNNAGNPASALSTFTMSQPSNYPVMKLTTSTGGNSTETHGLMITNGGNGYGLRVNDDGTETDSSPFVIDAGGTVGVGTDSLASAKMVIARNGGAVLNTSNMADQDIILSVTASGATDKYGLIAPSTATNLALGVGGVEKMRITNAGNVGIGTSSPQSLLNLYASAPVIQLSPSGYGGVQYSSFLGSMANAEGVLQLGNNGQNSIVAGNSVAGGFLRFVVNNTAAFPTAANGTVAMTITAAGNVGIGDTTPQKVLSVDVGSNNYASFANQIGLGAFAGIHFGYMEEANSNYRKSALVFERTDRDANNAMGKIHLLLDNSGANSAGLEDARFTIDEDYQVGIGTTTPANILQTLAVTGARFDLTGTGDNNTLVLNQRNGYAAGGMNMIQFAQGVNPSTNMRFGYNYDSNSLQMRSSANAAIASFLEGGNVGIGTTTPAGLLHVDSPSAQVILTADGNATETTDNIGIELRSDVYRMGQYASRLVKADETGGIPLYIQTNESGDNATWVNTARFGSYTANSNKFETFGQTALATAGGNIGIGITNPATILDIGGGTNYTNATAANQISSTTAKIIQVRDTAQSVLNLVSDINTAGAVIGALDFSRSGGQADSHINIAGVRARQTSTGVLAGGQLEFWTKVSGSSGDTRMTISDSGNVGIGISPSYKLDVSGNTRLGSSGTDYTYLGGTTYFMYGGASNSNLYALQLNRGAGGSSPDLWGGSGLTLGGTSGDSSQLVLKSGGNIGIGTTTPGYKLTINSTNGTDKLFQVATTTNQQIFTINNTGNVGIGTSSSPFKLDVVSNGALTARIGTAAADTLVIGGGQGKLTVLTFDPAYSIDGTHYATYGVSTIGIKEETTDNVYTTELVPNVGYKHTIDFKGASEGSDLWLFSRVVNIKKNISKMSVLLTAADNARTWYTVDPNNYTLSVYSSKPTLVSYRLSAPRVDAEKWTNYNHDLGISPLKIEMSFDDLTVASTSASTTPDIISQEFQLASLTTSWSALDARVSAIELFASSTTASLAMLNSAIEDQNLRITTLEANVSNLMNQASTTLATVLTDSQRISDLENLVASTTIFTSATSTFATTSSFMIAVVDSLSQTFASATTYFKDMVVEAMTIGKADKPTGITFYDSVTGEPYCLKMANGVQVTTTGICVANAPTGTVSDITQPEVTTSTTTPPMETTASSTPPIDESVASSTPPVDNGSTVVTTSGTTTPAI